MNQNQTVGKEGYGYWDITSYPIGGCFKRFSANQPVTNVKPLEGNCKGATHIGEITSDGKIRKIAFGYNCVEPNLTTHPTSTQPTIQPIERE